MSTLVRTLQDALTHPNGSTIVPIDSVLLADDQWARSMIEAGAVESLESATLDLDDIPAAVNKFGCRLDLDEAAQTINLTSLAAAGAARAGDGTTSFATVHCFCIRNCSTTAGDVITVGAAASQAFADWLGGTGPTVIVPPGATLILRNPAGWTTASKVNLKLDPGAKTFTATLAVAGIATP